MDTEVMQLLEDRLPERVHSLVEYLNQTYPSRNFTCVELTNYWKIITEPYGQRSVYCFIVKRNCQTKLLGNMELGDVMKAASWNSPAKHKRGNIFDKKTWHCFEQYGITYLK